MWEDNFSQNRGDGFFVEDKMIKTEGIRYPSKLCFFHKFIFQRKKCKFQCVEKRIFTTALNRGRIRDLIANQAGLTVVKIAQVIQIKS